MVGDVDAPQRLVRVFVAVGYGVVVVQRLSCGCTPKKARP